VRVRFRGNVFTESLPSTGSTRHPTNLAGKFGWVIIVLTDVNLIITWALYEF
jgi:hypothetical protein